MPRKGNKRKKTRTHGNNTVPEGAVSLSEDFKRDQEALSNVPRSIVAKTSKVAPMVSHLVKDIRKMMGPYTAAHLKERAYNRMKDFAGMASSLGVSHLLMLSQTEKNIVLRVAKSMTGPTVHFRVKEYSLAKQIKAMQKRPAENALAFTTPPLVVLNNFGSAEAADGMQHVRLMRIMLQNMLPAIDVKTVKLRECRRVVLFNYRKEDGMVELRHYAIKAQPVGISKSVKKIIQNKIPNLGGLTDISEFVRDGKMGDTTGAASDSEAEDVGARVTLAEKYRGRGNGATQQSAMKLTELGPRMTLELFKCERGVGEGDILYHKFQHKTPEEADATKQRIEKARQLKEQRRKEQESNVARKAQEEEERRLAKKARRTAREQAREASADSDEGDARRKRSRDDDDDENEEDDDDDDDDDEDEDDEVEFSDDDDDDDDEDEDDEVEFSDVDDGGEEEGDDSEAD